MAKKPSVSPITPKPVAFTPPPKPLVSSATPREEQDNSLVEYKNSIPDGVGLLVPVAVGGIIGIANAAQNGNSEGIDWEANGLRADDSVPYGLRGMNSPSMSPFCSSSGFGGNSGNNGNGRGFSGFQLSNSGFQSQTMKGSSGLDNSGRSQSGFGGQISDFGGGQSGFGGGSQSGFGQQKSGSSSFGSGSSSAFGGGGGFGSGSGMMNHSPVLVEAPHQVLEVGLNLVLVEVGLVLGEFSHQTLASGSSLNQARLGLAVRVQGGVPHPRPRHVPYIPQSVSVTNNETNNLASTATTASASAGGGRGGETSSVKGVSLQDYSSTYTLTEVPVSIIPTPSPLPIPPPIPT